MSRLTRDGAAEPVSRGQVLRRDRGQGNIHFPCSADHEQDWQPYPVDPYFAVFDDHTYILHSITYNIIQTSCYSKLFALDANNASNQYYSCLLHEMSFEASCACLACAYFKFWLLRGLRAVACVACVSVDQ